MIHSLSLSEFCDLLEGEIILLPPLTQSIRLQIEWDDTAIAMAKAYSAYIMKDITPIIPSAASQLTTSESLTHFGRLCLELADVREQ